MKLELVKSVDLETVTTPEGRLYRTEFGDLPSVTTLISKVSGPNPQLEEWKNRVGYQQAEWIRRTAGDYGTLFHKTIEKFLLEQTTPNSKEMKDECGEVIDFFTKSVDIIYGIECKMASRKMMVAGTTDCIAKLNTGDCAIIDYKTYKSLFPDTIEKYFTQACFYAIMFEEMHGVKIDNLILLAKKRGNRLLKLRKPTSEYRLAVELMLMDYGEKHPEWMKNRMENV